MSLKKYFLSLSLTCFALGIIDSEIFAEDYSAKVSETVNALNRAVDTGLSGENIAERAINIGTNAARTAFNSIPLLPKWERPIGDIRIEFYRAFVLLRTISEDTSLSETERTKLQSKLSADIGEALRRFTEDFQDPSDIWFLDQWRNADNGFLQFLALVGTRLAYPFVAAGYNIKEGVFPFDENGNFQAPSSMPFFGADARRDRIAGGALNDAVLVFRRALSNPAKYANQNLAREELVKNLGSAEPLKYAKVQSLALTALTMAQIWFVFNPQPELALTPTVLGPVLSAITYFVGFQFFKELHKMNSGFSVYKGFRRLNQAGTNFIGRFFRNRIEGIRNIGFYLSGKSCGENLQALNGDENSPRRRRPTSVRR